MLYSELKVKEHVKLMDGSNFIETGDKGTSALWTGERHDKSSHIFHCLGAIDEINAYLGLVIFKLKHLR